MNRALTLVLLISTVVTVGCTTTPKTQFSEYYQVESHSPNVDVIIDTIVLSDISGDDIGINKEKNEVAYNLVNESVPSIFAVRGYSPNILHSGNGSYLEIENDTQYFISEDFESTDVPYTGIEKTENNKVWVDESVNAFIKRLTEFAPHAHKKQQSTRSKKKIEPITIDEIPESIMQLPNDTLLLIRAYAGDVSTGKSVGVGLATGLISAVLSGGMYIHVAVPISGSRIEIIAFDKKTAKIVWHNTIRAGDYKRLDKSIEMAMTLFPTTTNTIYKRPFKSRKSRKFKKPE
jgi:hypothetical protein